ARVGGDRPRGDRSRDHPEPALGSSRGRRAGAAGQRGGGERAARHPPLRGVPRDRRIAMEPADAAGAQFARKRPGWFTKNVFNRIVAALTRLGISLLGSRVLEVRGRSSGLARRTPVNLLTLDGERYLVAPRGDTQWARNLRVSGEGRLL